jgi:lipoate-protein ligase A
VTPELDELYDYDALRSIEEPTMFVVRLGEATLVLGTRQSRGILDIGRIGQMALRRRRGGGGLVFLQPDDLWIDWWIPTSDARWSGDVRVSALTAGEWWREALSNQVDGDITVHDGPLRGNPQHRVVCFAGRGPGEVFVDGRKAVGLAQWRVREGILLTSVLPAGPTAPVVDFLTEPPAGLFEALDHHVTSSLSLEPEALVADLASVSGPWRERQLFLTA